MRYYMFNKPRGCISARRDARRKTVMDYFPEEDRELLFHVGRLDRDTEGLLILTDDGELCHRLMSPENLVTKTYFFWAQGLLSPDMKAEIEGGISISDSSEKLTAPAKISLREQKQLVDIRGLLSDSDLKLTRKRGSLPVISGEITVTEGKKHQVKKMLGYAGCRVVYLKRLSIGALALDPELSAGEYRPLTEEEIRLLFS